MKALIWRMFLICGMRAKYSRGNFASYIRTRSKGEKTLMTGVLSLWSRNLVSAKCDIPVHWIDRLMWDWQCVWIFFLFFFSQLQQVIDSFIIYAAQATMTNLQRLPSHSLDSDAQLKIPWTQYSPSDIRLAPFPTREYTDDEFQSIVKKVMGVLYVNSIFLFFLSSYWLSPLMYVFPVLLLFYLMLWYIGL